MSEWHFWVVAYQKLPETESIYLVPFKEIYGGGLDLIKFVKKLISYFLSENPKTCLLMLRVVDFLKVCLATLRQQLIQEY